jgi:asparagine synthase (glutamine-hydrolysing)
VCGIAGWYRRRNNPVCRRLIEAQCDSIVHRGPDDSGVFVDGDFGFGMRRLSILDIAGGHQPMTSVDGRHVIVFNGEIYNHRALRQDIGGRYAFRTRSDTETILAAFQVWGNDAWARLEGMFTAAIWDSTNRTLTLARDQLGIKPLYISEQEGGLAFASELQAIRKLPDQQLTIDEGAVQDFFSFGHVRRPKSIYREIRTLEPGCFLTLRPTGASSTHCYWRPQFREPIRQSESDWIEQMREIMIETTSAHMQSDVPVAAFLSGGIDSSTVLAAMVQAGRKPVQAFTISHPGHSIDEAAAAARIARHLGCEHVIAPLVDEEAIAELPNIVACYDEPFADMAAIPTWFLSKLAAERVKVILCGEGGDELFYGYKRHRNADWIARHRALMGGAGAIAGVIGNFPTTPSRKLNRIRQYAQRFGEFAAASDGLNQFFLATQISSESVRRRILSPMLRREDATSRNNDELSFSEGQAGAKSPLDQFVYADLTINLPSAMLTRLDRASMAHSLEARVPFLTSKMVDWALSVPVDLKLHRGIGKYVLRRAAEPWLPSEILKLPKQGFQIPMASWLRGQFGKYALEIWLDSGAESAGFVDGTAVKSLFAEHRTGAADHSRLLYALLVFAFWWSGRRDLATN